MTWERIEYVFRTAEVRAFVIVCTGMSGLTVVYSSLKERFRQDSVLKRNCKVTDFIPLSLFSVRRARFQAALFLHQLNLKYH